MRAPWLPNLQLLLSLTISFVAGRRSWIPLRVASRWAAVREVDPGREYWLRPECRLNSSLPKDCTSEWVVSVTFWSLEWLAEVQSALRKTVRCTRSSLCTVHPFQTSRVSLSDQQARWSIDRVRFVNGPLPSKLQFRLRRRDDTSRGNCSFDAENLIIEMSDESESLDSQKIITGYEVRSAYRDLDKSEAQQEAGTAARRIVRTLLRQKAPRATIVAADQLTKALADWAGWVGLLAGSRQLRNRTQSADVFRRFPQAALLSIQGIAKASAVQRFSVVVVQSQSPPEQPNRRAAVEQKTKEKNELAEVQQRLSDLESYVSQMEVNSNYLNATTSPSTRSLLFLKYSSRSSSNSSNTTRNSGNGNPYASRNIQSIDDCAETLDPSSDPIKKKSKTIVQKLRKTTLFYSRPLKRLVRCGENGELVILQRQKNNVDFNRSWADYRRGFGDAATGDFWLGLDFLANYTATGDVCASIELVPWRLNVTDTLIQYSDFEIGSEHQDFRLGYGKSTSKFISDALTENRGQPFSTYDRDRDAFVGNCASTFGGGNWFKSCTRAHIFGKLDARARGSGMCWRGVHHSQGDMCSPLTAITMSVWRASQVSRVRTVIFSSIAPKTERGRYAQTKDLLINATGLYFVMAGGGPGGVSKSGNRFFTPGGRGAMIRTQRLLRAGTRLRIVVGRAGGTGRTCGHGGDATWITALGTTSKLLLVAGGGGGGGTRSRGTHGRAVKSGYKAIEAFASTQVTVQRIRGKVSESRGRGWQHLKDQLLNRRNSASYYAESGVQTYIGGGGGGGYEGGFSGRDETAGGGGGGSFCDESSGVNCEITEGGNLHNSGFVIIEKRICF